MFKNLTINLSAPICSCTPQEYSWGIGFNIDCRTELHLTCKGCKTELIIPNKKFVAEFNIDKKEDKKENKEEDKNQDDNDD